MAVAKAQPKPKVVLSPGPAPIVKTVAPKPIPAAPKAIVPKAVAQPFQTYKADVKLGPGQILAFQAGKGYYAKDAPVVKKPPVDDGGGDVGGDEEDWGWNPGPNYGAALVGSPDFTEANAAYEENVRLAHDQRQRRIRAALIKLGFQPGGANAKALEGIDPSTAELAANNSASALAKLGLKRGTDRADLSAELAGRGLLDSGALRGGENMVQTSYDQGLLGATQDYLTEQDTALGDEATALATGQNVFTAAKAQAAQAAAQNPLFTPTWRAGPQGQTLATGQGTRPDQTPVLAKPPPLVAVQPKAPKVVLKPKPKVVLKPKAPGGSNQGFRGLL